MPSPTRKPKGTKPEPPPDNTPSPMQQVWTTMPRPAAVFSQEAKQEALLMARGVPMGLPTGFVTLDHQVRLREGQLIVIAARTSFGKTSLALQIAMHNALKLEATWDDGCVVFFSAEMSGAELFQKMASVRSGINLQRGYTGQWSQADAKTFNDALDDLSTLPLVVNDLTQINTETMRDNLKMLARAGRPARLVVFDYVELGTDDGKFKEHERVAMVVHRLKAIARDLNIPVLALSQISRDLERESRHRLPLIHNLAGSDAVGRTADKVLTLLIPNLYLRKGQACACEYLEDSLRTAYLSVQKDRFGINGTTFRLVWTPETASFDDLPSTDPRPPYVEKLTVRNEQDATKYWATLATPVQAGPVPQVARPAVGTTLVQSPARAEQTSGGA